MTPPDSRTYPAHAGDLFGELHLSVAETGGVAERDPLWPGLEIGRAHV